MIRDIIKGLKPYKYWLAGSIISNILMAIFTIVGVPLFMPFFKLLFDPKKYSIIKATLPDNPNMRDYLNYELIKFIEGKDFKTALIYVILAFFVSFLLKNIFRYLAAFFITPVRTGYIRDLRKELYNHLVGLPLSFFKNRKRGDLLSRMSMDMQEVENSIVNGFDALIKSPIIIIGTLAMMLFMSPKLTLFVIVLLPLTVLLIGGVSRKMKTQSSSAQNYLGLLLSILEETIGSLKVIKSFNAMEMSENNFNETNNAYKNILTKLHWRREIGSPLAEILGILIVSSLMWYAGILIYEGDLDSAEFISFIYAFFLIIEPSKSFSAAYYSFQKGAAALERIDEIMEAKNDIKDSENTVVKTSFEKSIEFKNVWFKYADSDSYILKDISFKIEKGQKIAFIGASGAGKTTLADLLSRFYDIQKGQILIDNIDIREINLKSLRNIIGIVSQDSLLFHDNIINNIVFSDKNYDQDKLEKSIDISSVKEFVPDLETAEKTIIGDQGTKLSGGQKQRIAIARAIYKNAPILVLDEATSALDSESEKKVKLALDEVMKNKTSVIIAHRLSTISEVDKIVVLDKGEIIEIGSPNELLKNKSGAYYKFINLQKL